MIINEKETFIFDLDGTLIDSFSDVKQAINQALIDLGFAPLETIAIKALIGPNLSKPLTKIVNNPAFDYQKFEPIFSDYYTKKNTRNTCLYPDVITVLKDLSNKNKNLFILTNKPTYQSVEICKQLNISQYMLEIIGPDIYEPKPSNKAIINIIQNYNLNQESCVMIGDTEIDIQTSKAANITSIAITYGYRSKDELLEQKPDYIIDSLADLLTLKSNSQNKALT